MATYVPQMEKARNTFILEAKNGIEDLFRWCKKFEFNLNIISYSFVKSISRLSQSFGYQTDQQELIIIFNAFNSFLAAIEKDFNSQLQSIIHKYHSLKSDYAACIENGLDTINEGIKQALIFQMKFKRLKKSKLKAKNFFLQMKEKINIFREEIENMREYIIHSQKSFMHTLIKCKERNQKLMNSIKNESNKFDGEKESLSNQLKMIKKEEETNQKFKADANNNNNYYFLINNIENETEMIRKLKLKFENEIREIKNKNNEERKKYIDSFKEIHDKICKNMDEMNALHKYLEDLRASNEREEAKTRSFYNSEEKKIRHENQKIFELKKEIELIINEVNKDFEIEYNDHKDQILKRIEIEKQNEENELKNYQNFLLQKNQKILNDLYLSYEKNSIQIRIEKEYETKYNEYLKQLTSPVFSTAIGYERSQDVSNLLAKKDTILSSISNERNHMITKSKSEIVTRNSILKHQNSKPKSIIQMLNEEKILFKKLYNDQIESNILIRKKEKESRIEIRKIQKEINMARRVYLTKKLYLMDALSFSFDYSNLTDQLKNDENNDKEIENLEEKISIQMNLCDSKNSLNYKKVKQLENEVDRLNESLNNLLEKYIKVKKQCVVQKNDRFAKLALNQNGKMTKNVIRSKSSQSPNVISPKSSRNIKQKMNISNPS